jgi:hypothetical protein
LTQSKRVRIISKNGRDNSASLSRDTKNARSDDGEALAIEDDNSEDEEKGSIYDSYNSLGKMTTSFICGLGIDREVITTDICHYLGNDALVRPGSYQPVTMTLRSCFGSLHRHLTLF